MLLYNKYIVDLGGEKMLFFRNLVKNVMSIYMHIVYRMKIDGLENIPKEGGAILCSNHIHALDSIAYGVHIKRMVYAMAKEALFRTKFKNWFMRHIGCFPVKAGAASEEAINTAIDLLKRGELVMIFPEGTRNGIAKGVKPKKGAALIAVKAGVPIIPMGIMGTFKPFSKIVMHIGKPIDTSTYSSEEINPREVVKLSSEVWDEVVRLTELPQINKKTVDK